MNEKLTKTDDPRNDKKAYVRPTVTDMGDLREVTRGAMGSHNDGNGGGAGMAENP